MNVIRLASFDPGGTTGFCTAEIDLESKRGQILGIGQIAFARIFDELLKFETNVFIFEGYRIRTTAKDDGWSHQWDDGKALQVIGAIRHRAAACGAVEVEQQPSIKPIGYGFMGSTYKKGKKDQHVKDALAHLHFYLVKSKGCSPNCLNLSTRAEP